MAWSYEIPTEEGAYWWQDEDLHAPNLVWLWLADKKNWNGPSLPAVWSWIDQPCCAYEVISATPDGAGGDYVYGYHHVTIYKPGRWMKVTADALAVNEPWSPPQPRES